MFGPFGRGEAAMGITYMSQLPNIIELCATNGVEFGSVELPKGVHKACMFTGTNVAIFNTVPEIERRDAFRFLRFFLTPEIQSLWGTRSGCLPLSWKVLNSRVPRVCGEGKPCEAGDPALVRVRVQRPENPERLRDSRQHVEGSGRHSPRERPR